MTKWYVEVLRRGDRDGDAKLTEWFKSYAEASAFARTWPLSDVRISKLAEVAYFNGKPMDLPANTELGR